MSYPPPTQPMRKKPGIAGIIIGLLLIVALGPAIGLAGGHVVDALTPKTLDGPSHAADGTPLTVELEAGREMGVWAGLTADGGCDVFDPSGAPVTLEERSLSSGIDSYHLQLAFIPQTSGTYTVVCEASFLPFTYVVSSTDVVGIRGTAALIPLIGGLAVMIGGMVLTLITFARRVQWNRQASSHPPGPYPDPRSYMTGQQAYPSTQPPPGGPYYPNGQ